MDDDVDQRIHDLENEQASLKSQVKDKDSRVQELESSNTDLKNRLNATLADLQREKAEKEAAQAKVQANLRLAADKEAALRTVDELRRHSKKQEDSYDALEQEIEKLQAKLRKSEQECGDAKDDAEAKSREAASVNRRAASLQSQCEELEKELDARTKALAQYRGEKTAELTEVKAQLAEAHKLLETQKNTAAAAQSSADALRARLERTEEHMKAMMEKCATDRADLEKQIALQETLTNLQKERGDELAQKISGLQREIQARKRELTAERVKTDKERERADMVRDKSKAIVEELKAKLLQEEANAKQAGVAAEAAAAANGRVGAADAVPMHLSVDLDSLNDTELKMRLMKLERELAYVRSDRDRNELYLTRILKEVDQKSPLLMSNKKDYQRVLQSHEQLFLKVEDSMRRCQRAEMEREAAAKQRDRLEKQLEAAKDSLADTGAQVQRLLRDKLERDLGRPIERGSANGNGKLKSPSGQLKANIIPDGNIIPPQPDQIIADNWVTFEDIRGLQEQNIMLLQVVRSLTAELKDSRIEQDESVDERAVVDELTRQVDNLKADRERQAEMLITVTNARDMYRVLLAQETNKDLAASADGGGGGGPSAATVKAAVEEAEAMKSRVHELERDLGVAREETSKLQHSLKLMGDEVTKAERNTSRAVSALAATQRMLSHAEDQVKVITQDRDSKTAALEHSSSKFAELANNVVELQGQLEAQKNIAFDARNTVKDLQLTNTGLTIDKKMLQRAEEQLRGENERLRKDARRTDDMVDRLTKIDRTLGAKSNAEIATLREELARLRRQAEDDRRLAASAEADKEKAMSLAREERHSLQKDLDLAKAEASSAKQAAVAATAAETATREKASELSARLQEARSRLVTGIDELGGDSGGGDSSMSSQLAEVGKLQMELQATKAELKAKTEALATDDRQRLQYEAIAKSKQQQLDQLMSAKDKMQEDLEAKAKEAVARAENAEAEVRETKTRLASTVAEFMKDKEIAETEAKTQRALVVELKDQLQATNDELTQERVIVTEVKEELETQQKAVKAADERYRREIEAHAGAITALRQAEDAQDAFKKAKQDADDARAALAADLMRAKAQWAARERELRQVTEAAEARFAGVNSQNEILHSHLQTLTQQVEAAQAKRESEDKAKVDEQLEGDGGTTATAAAAGEEGEGGSAKGGEDNEKLRLARSVKELTELIRFNRRDMQVLSTNLEMSQQRVAKSEAELERTKKSLREAREEVQRAARDSADAVSKTQHKKLLVEVEQLSTLRESNTMLRNSLRDAEDRTRQAMARAKELELQAAPLHQSEKMNSAAAAALASEKDSLKKEVENWKRRVTSLTSSFNAVDPKDHEELKGEKAKLEQDLAESERAKEALEKGKADLLRSKAAVEKERDDANTIKGKMLATVGELRRTVEGSKREAAAQKAGATRDLEAKLAAEKERVNKANLDIQTLRQEAARARIMATNAHTSTVKSLTDQLNKAKAEIESFKKQATPSRPQDSTAQVDALRKEVTRLQTKLEEVQRENTQNFNMYERMKDINRKMKASVASFQNENSVKDDKIKELEASIAAGLTNMVNSTTIAGPAGSDTMDATTPTAALDAATPQGQGTTGTRPTPAARSISPARAPSARGVSPTQGVSGAAAAGAWGDDGSEASLRNKLMARTKRPLASSTSPDTAGPSKRVATSSAPTGSGGGDTASGAAAAAAGDSRATPVAQPPTASTFAANSAGETSSSSATPAPAPGTNAAAPATTAPSLFGAPAKTSLNPTASPFSGFGGGTWGGVRRAGGGANAPAPAGGAAPGAAGGAFGRMTWGRPAATTSAPVPTLTASTSTTATTTAAPAVMTTTTTPASAVTPTRMSMATTSASTATMTASKEAQSAQATAVRDDNVVQIVGDNVGGAPASGGVVTSGGAASSSPLAAASATTTLASPSYGFGAASSGGTGSLFGAAVGAPGSAARPGFASFGSASGFGREVASMKPPNANAAFSTFPAGKLPVPEKPSDKSGTGRATFASAASTAATPSGVPSSAAATGLNTAAAKAPATFGAGAGSGAGSASAEGKFGLSPFSGGAASSFEDAVPLFGRPAAAPAPSPGAFRTAGASTTPSAAAVDSATSAGSVPTGSAAGAGAGENKTPMGDAAASFGSTAASAAAGVPGPGALALDMDARRAARLARFQVPGTPSQPAAGATEATTAAVLTDPDAAAGNASQQSQKEDVEIDEDEDGDAL